MKEVFYILLIAFLLFGFLRRFVYFQAYQSFTKAAEDFQKRHNRSGHRSEKEMPKSHDRLKDVGEYVDYEEVK